MADISDVLVALTDIAAAAVYPNGTSQTSVAGVDVDIYPGWPVKNILDAAIAQGKARVSIFPTHTERDTTRFNMEYQTVSINAPTIVLTVNNLGSTITVTGTVSTPQVCMVTLNNVLYVYTVLSNDTLSTIATGIASLLPNASATDAIVTVLGATSLNAIVNTAGISIRELSRRERVISVDVWAPNDTIRTAIGSAIDIAFCSLVRFALPDGYWALIRYHSTNQIDDLQKSRVYRRNLNFVVEYAVTQSQTSYTIGTNNINVELVASGSTVLPSP